MHQTLFCGTISESSSSAMKAPSDRACGAIRCDNGRRQRRGSKLRRVVQQASNVHHQENHAFAKWLRMHCFAAKE